MKSKSFPAWLRPRIADALPFVAPVVVSARLAAGYTRDVPRRKGSTNAGGLARAAVMSHEDYVEMGRKGGAASQAARSKEERRAIAQAGARASNLKRWGFRG